MAKKPSLSEAMAQQSKPEPALQLVEEPPKVQGARPKGRDGQTNVSGWFDISVKLTLDELRLKRQRELKRRVTLQELMGEAFNDVFKKYGLPEVVPEPRD